MIIPYRTRRILHRVGIALLVVLVLAILTALCWTIWLERFLVYTRDGVVLDFDQSYELPEGVVAQPPVEQNSVSIFFNEGDYAVETSTELTQLKGYYIDTTVLSSDIEGAMATVRSLDSGTAVMIDVKSNKGLYYYSTAMTDAGTANIDLDAADTLIQMVTKGDYYAIARLPAFQNYTYGLNNVTDGLPYAGGSGYLWVDDEGCYWLNPTKTGVLNYLIRVVEELKSLGFDEVVFTDFCFPSTEKVSFSGDKTEAITAAMNTLITNCNTNSFCVSFSVTDHTLAVPDGRSRLYLEGVAAKNAAQIASLVLITDPDIRLVFMADTNDTRFDAYGVMRSIDAAMVLEN